MRPEDRPAFYLDRDSAWPGARIELFASAAGRTRASLVRLSGIAGVPMPDRYLEHPAGWSTTLDLTVQEVPRGSSARTPQGPAVVAGERWCWRLRLQPWLVDSGTVIGWGEVQLSMAHGQLHACHGGGAVHCAIDSGRWSDVTLDFAAGTLTLAVAPVGADCWHRCATHASAQTRDEAVAGSLTFGHGFNGRIESPTLKVDGAIVAHWDFARGMMQQLVPGSGPRAADLTLVNAPRRAVTGSAWTGRVHDWRQAPAEYGAIHFHDDDIADCGWPLSGVLDLPDGLAGGVHVVRLENDAGVRHVPLFVRSRRARIVWLASTLSYLAYGNSLWQSASGTAWQAGFPADLALSSRFGASSYSLHRDGSGIGLVSRRRPILSTTPGFLGEAIGGQVLFNDDLRIIAWLDAVGEPYDVITDHDLHSEGASALAGHEVLVTGCHPEYHTRETLDAIEGFAARGGRILYMGANGFYWRVGLLPDMPHVMEIRRAEGGIRTWAEPPGEYHHQSDGELGGLWRRLGRPPNRLVGAGFSAQGSETETRAFVPAADAQKGRAAFLWEGVKSGPIGADQGFGAAAGYELDRADTALGTPPHAVVVARSAPFGPLTFPVNEERLTGELLATDDPCRAEIVFAEGPNGGATLALGSIMAAGCLSESDGLGRLAANALRRFVDPLPLVPAVPCD
jgi:N,N-dimethylformamidase